MLAVKVGKSLGDSACTALYECGAPDSQERGEICNAYLFACNYAGCFNNAVHYCSQRANRPWNRPWNLPNRPNRPNRPNQPILGK